MPSTPEDRLFGITTSVAVKPPVSISADYNVTTYGEQTITSSTMTGDRTITTTQDMRVLLMNQDDKRDNGIWMAGPVAWRRAPDFDGSRDAVNGTLVFNIYGDCWQLEGTNPIRIGNDEISFRSTYPFSEELNLYQRTIRTSDPYIEPLPPIAQLEGKILAISGGKPVGVLPESGSAADVMAEFASNEVGKGAALVNTTADKTVQDEINGIHESLNDISTNGVAKLSTARNINGVAFDGTANISIPAGNVGAYTKAEVDSRIAARGAKNTASKIARGWWKCGDTGVVFQWGTVGVGDNLPVTFPIAFPSACISVQLSKNNSNYAGTSTANMSATEKSITGFIAHIYHDEVGADWLAVGY